MEPRCVIEVRQAKGPRTPQGVPCLWEERGKVGGGRREIGAVGTEKKGGREVGGGHLSERKKKGQGRGRVHGGLMGRNEGQEREKKRKGTAPVCLNALWAVRASER